MVKVSVRMTNVHYVLLYIILMIYCRLYVVFALYSDRNTRQRRPISNLVSVVMMLYDLHVYRTICYEVLKNRNMLKYFEQIPIK